MSSYKHTGYQHVSSATATWHIFCLSVSKHQKNQEDHHGNIHTF